jgi:hypothetical protein
VDFLGVSSKCCDSLFQIALKFLPLYPCVLTIHIFYHRKYAVEHRPVFEVGKHLICQTKMAATYISDMKYLVHVGVCL